VKGGNGLESSRAESTVGEGPLLLSRSEIMRLVRSGWWWERFRDTKGIKKYWEDSIRSARRRKTKVSR
jgi:hypothetical protein